VPLESKFQVLQTRVRAVVEPLAEVRTTIREDHPAAGETVLVDIFGDAVDDVLGWLAESQDGALEAEQALAHPPRLDLARRGLAASQQAALNASQRFEADLVQYARSAALVRLGRERGGEWRAWARTLKQGLERCQPPLFELHQALFDCWLELTERTAELSPHIESASLRQGGG
jgi:hypothetical protein